MKISVDMVKRNALKAGFVVLAVVAGFVLVTSLEIADPAQAKVSTVETIATSV